MFQTQRPLRILHLHGASLKLKGGALTNSVAAMLTNGFTRLGHQVVTVVDRDLARQLSPFASRKLGALQANRHLPKLLQVIKPDLLVFGHADVVRTATVAEIRAALPQMKTMQWNIDPLVQPDNVRRINNKVEYCDATFVTTAGPLLDQFRAPGRVVGFMPNPSDPSIERLRNFEQTDFTYDLTCLVHGPDFPRQVGTVYMSPREIAARLGTEAPEVSLGVTVPGTALGGSVFGDRYDVVLGRSRMGLNLSRNNDIYLYSSERMSHYVANGLLTFVDRGTGFGDLFGEDELAFYSSFEDFVERLRAFKRDDAARRAVAQKGWAHYHAMFDATRVAQFMLSTLDLAPKVPGCEWEFTLKPAAKATPAPVAAASG